MNNFIPYFPFDEYFGDDEDGDDLETGFTNYVKKRWTEEADA